MTKANEPNGVDVYDSRAYEAVWVRVPDDWDSWRVALLIMDVASGSASSENTSDLAAQFDRFVGARFVSTEDEGGADADAAAADPYADAAARAVSVKLGSLDPENLPHSTIRKLIAEGKAVEKAKFIGRDLVVAVGIPLPLASGLVKSLIIEFVPPGWFSKPRWRIVGVGPDITNYPLERAMDTYVFSPKEAAAAQQAANLAELTLHVIPLGAFADYSAQAFQDALRGDWESARAKGGEAAISLAGDVAMVLTGGGSKAIATALKAKKYVKSAETAAKGLQTAGMITEASIAGIRGVQGGWKLYESGGKSGYGEIGEAILRTFGVAVMLRDPGTRKGVAALWKDERGSFGFSQAAENVMTVERRTLLGGERVTDFLVQDGMGPGFLATLEGKTLQVGWNGRPGTLIFRLGQAQQLAGGPGSITRIEGYASEQLLDMIRGGQFDASRWADIVGRRLGGKWSGQVTEGKRTWLTFTRSEG